jgi:thiamine monophosphate synthase
MRSQPLPEDVLRAFDAVVLLLNDLAQEAVDIKTKYGERSKLYKTRLEQIEKIKALYNASKSFIEVLVNRNTVLAAEVIGLQVHLTQELYGMSFSQAAKVLELDFSPEFIAAQDQVDKIIQDLRGLKL